MKITLNGTDVEFDDGLTVAALLEQHGVEDARGVAVAVNGAVVPHAHWPKVSVKDGDAVEIIHAVQGG